MPNKESIIWIFKGAESKKWHLFCAKTTHSLCFGLFFIQGKLNTANSSGRNSRKYTPLYGTVCSMVLVLAYLNPKMLIKNTNLWFAIQCWAAHRTKNILYSNMAVGSFDGALNSMTHDDDNER